MRALFCFCVVIGGAGAMASAQALPVEPFHDRGQGVTPAYEGWFQNPDRTYSLSFGYFSRNQVQELDIPTGENNRLEPGGPDRDRVSHPARRIIMRNTASRLAPIANRTPISRVRRLTE